MCDSMLKICYQNTRSLTASLGAEFPFHSFELAIPLHSEENVLPPFLRESVGCPWQL